MVVNLVGIEHSAQETGNLIVRLRGDKQMSRLYLPSRKLLR